MRTVRLSLTVLATAGVALSGCATVARAAPARTGPQAVASASCAGIRNVDLQTLNASLSQRLADPVNRAWLDDTISGVVPDEDAIRRPPFDASVLIRARIPAGGIHSLDDKAVIWREADGSWWVWRLQFDTRAPQPPPITPPPEGHPDPEGWMAQQRYYRESYFQVPRPVQGRIAPEAVAAIEAALADPCRAHDPDGWLNATPLIQPEDGRDQRLCPLDSAMVVGEITEAGRPARRVFAACANETPTYRLLMAVLGATPGA